jgi:hypothetical protein
MRLDIKIFTGEATMRYFEKLTGRTGHMVLTIWPPTEPASREVRWPL